MSSYINDFNTSSFLSKREYVLALNFSGIKTDDFYDLYDDNSQYDKSDYIKVGLSKQELINSLPPKRTGVSGDEILEICLNAKAILKNNGIEIDKDGLHPSNAFVKTITVGTSSSYLISSLVENNTVKLNLFNSILASANPSDLENFDSITDEKSSKGTKTVKKLNYTYDNISVELIKNLKDLAINIAKGDTAKYVDLIEKLPYYAQGFITEDEEFFKVTFLDSWTLSGGSTAQLAAHKVFSDFGVNEQLNDFWHEQTHLLLN